MRMYLNMVQLQPLYTSFCNCQSIKENFLITKTKVPITSHDKYIRKLKVKITTKTQLQATTGIQMMLVLHKGKNLYGQYIPASFFTNDKIGFFYGQYIFSSLHRFFNYYTNDKIGERCSTLIPFVIYIIILKTVHVVKAASGALEPEECSKRCYLPMTLIKSNLICYGIEILPFPPSKVKKPT